VGSNRERQALIVDTGSGIAAIPCKNYCRSCGNGHLNEFFDLDRSTSKYVYQCNQDISCTCMEGNKCSFVQQYGEGSLYRGFLVKDEVYFGEIQHLGLDAFNFTFGCVQEETNLFYSQEADGILGMTRGSSNPHMRPIFEVMHEQKLIERRMFTLCLGKDGGYF